MNSSQQTRLENFTAEEKRRLASIFRKKFLVKSVIYIPLILGSVFIIVYFNFFTEGFDNLGLLDLAFGINIALCGRIYIGDVSEYRQESNLSVKKVVETRILKHEGDKIFIGNQHFERQNILLDAPDFDSLQAGDPVRVEHSAKSHILFSVKRI